MSPPGWIPPIDERAAGERKNHIDKPFKEIVINAIYTVRFAALPEDKALCLFFIRQDHRLLALH